MFAQLREAMWFARSVSQNQKFSKMAIRLAPAGILQYAV